MDYAQYANPIGTAVKEMRPRQVVLDALDRMNRTLDSIDSHLEKLARVLG